MGKGVALACIPCCSKIEYFQYFFCRPLSVLMAINILVAGLGLSIIFSNAIPVIIAAMWAVIHSYRKTKLTRRIVMFGNVNPAIVIGKNPWRVAIYGDLTTGFSGSRPAIKVMMAPLRWIPGGPPKIGMRLCAPSTYMKGPDPCAWTTFFPLIFETVTRDLDEIQAVMNSIEPSEWAPLEIWIRQNPNPGYGLYRLWPGTDNVIVKPSRKQLWKTMLWTAHAVLFLTAAIEFSKIKWPAKMEQSNAVAPTTPPRSVRTIPSATPRDTAIDASQADLQRQVKDAQQQMRQSQEQMF